MFCTQINIFNILYIILRHFYVHNTLFYQYVQLLIVNPS